nr:immunoglobulin heavy chain junction region [Macaca mulatta]MOV40759.1 immunoglobulin heavy chain junction region [Macaca mulatta]MOV43256.1 immunoglobulin heavy chain junction region [Macaca mulatta]MOV43496.1 immunoglobulin heavy chain junction region [Macaca mulatta]MOV44180.1 immunoglobulin heavy chain junction region [Macaca mulatta]
CARVKGWERFSGGKIVMTERYFDYW